LEELPQSAGHARRSCRCRELVKVSSTEDRAGRYPWARVDGIGHRGCLFIKCTWENTICKEAACMWGWGGGESLSGHVF